MSDENRITRRYEYGLRIDCTKNGCAKPHGDNGVVIPRDDGQTEVNGHACSLVRRWVDTGAWLPHREETPT